MAVEYRFGAGLMCESQGVERVRVRVGDDAEEEADCNPAEPITVSDVPTGSHELLVQGLDAVGDPVRDSRGSSTNPTMVEILDGLTREVEVVLTPTPAQLQFRFDVNRDDGFAGICPNVVPHFFVVQAFSDSGELLHEHEWAFCGGGEANSYGGGFETMPDPDRELEGRTVSNVAVEVLDAEREEIDLVTFHFEPPGAGKALQLVVTCQGALCDAGPVRPAPSDDDAPSDETGGANETDGVDETGGAETTTG